jgi:DNA replication protein DnaC
MDLLLQELEQTACPHCEGRGMRIVDNGGRRHAEPCSCQRERRNARVMKRARIPARFADCSLENFDWRYPGADKSLWVAHKTATEFVKSYPIGMDGQGLLISGQVGTGKTHLAVAVLHALITERGATGTFYDYQDMLKTIQRSYDPQVAMTESDALAPMIQTEILVLDEVGASRVTDWVSDTIAHILNSRYNEKKITILTTNYPNLPPLEVTEAQRKGTLTPLQESLLARRNETLGDRITERIRSRLQEMCSVIEMTGEDWRRNLKLARLP